LESYCIRLPKQLGGSEGIKMSWSWISFVVALFFGAALGVFFMVLLISSRKREDREVKSYGDLERN
jgi:hypothetical protein